METIVNYEPKYNRWYHFSSSVRNWQNIVNVKDMIASNIFVKDEVILSNPWHNSLMSL
jgi:hypothetical protein